MEHNSEKMSKENDGATVVIERVFNHPVSKIWKAITDKDQMKQWYFPLDDFRPVKGFQFSFPGQGVKGQEYIHLCTITEIVPEQKLQYSWQYEGYPGYTLVTFELSEVENGTKVRLSHSGLDTFPQDNEDFAKENFTGGWTMLIGELLPEFLARQPV